MVRQHSKTNLSTRSSCQVTGSAGHVDSIVQTSVALAHGLLARPEKQQQF